MLEKETSLIIPAYRDNPAYATCLASVARLDPAPGEVIIVIDGNDRATIARAEHYGFKTVVLDMAPGVAAARNAGAHAASGALLIFTDSDIELPRSFIAQTINIFEHSPEYAAAIGSYDNHPSAPGLVSRYRNMLHHFTHQQGRVEAQTFWGGCGAILKDAFDSVGGFDASYRTPSVEDIELGYRLRKKGYRIRLEPDWQVKHLKTWTLANMIRTDLFCRAIPWSRLLVRETRMDNDLNIDTASRASGILAVLLVAGLAGGSIMPAFMLMSVAALAGIVILNRSFLSLLFRRGGLPLMTTGLFLHLVYLLCAVTGFAIGRFSSNGERSAAAGVAS